MGSFDVDFSHFSYSYTCLIVFSILMVLGHQKDLGLFVKINTLGVIFTIIIIIFIIGIGIQSITLERNGPLKADLEETNPIKLTSDGYPSLLGILGGGYYLHNISLPIYRNSKNPENNVRDVFIGYLLVFLSYTICGVLGYIGFSSKSVFD